MRTASLHQVAGTAHSSASPARTGARETLSFVNRPFRPRWPEIKRPPPSFLSHPNPPHTPRDLRPPFPSVPFPKALK